MTSSHQPPGQSGDLTTDTPASLTTPPSSATLNSLPVLTDIVTQPIADPGHTLSAEALLQLQSRLETHIETLFAQKLGVRLEQLQRQAIDQALAELKNELPTLVRESLNGHFRSS